ncbi:MAG TPA: methyltransferase domain-containing protein [Acidimicrobiales bacterium]|jgi:SAM-dependent methyltransferase
MAATLVTDAGEQVDLAPQRWWAAADLVERKLLARLDDPVLDVGCGPGRIVAALAGEGRVAMGVDPSPRAVDEATRRRAPALRRSVFDPLPGEGRWGSVVLLDGNVGIGGDPRALFRRCAALVRPGGRVVAEVAAPGAPSGPLTVRLEAGGEAGPWFPWARLAAGDVAGVATAAGLRVDGIECRAGRWFAWVARP